MEKQTEDAVKRICEVIGINQENERLPNEYEDLADDLLDWINRKRPELDDRSFNNGKLPEGRLDEFLTYYGEEKPPKLEAKEQIVAKFDRLQTGLRLTNRPLYIPSEGKLVTDIDKAWKGLGTAEEDSEDWILLEMRKQERLDYLANNFRLKSEIHENWTKNDDVEQLKLRIDYKSMYLHAVNALMKKHEAFQSDLAAQRDRVEQFVSIAQELNALGYSAVDEINARCKSNYDQFADIGDVTTRRSQELQDAIDVLTRIDNMHMAFAKKASPFRNWMDGAKEDLRGMISVHSAEEIMELRETHEQFKANMPAAQEEYESIMQLEIEITSLTALSNLYTDIKAQDIRSKWEEVLNLIPERDDLLRKENDKQQFNEQLRIQFAERANAIVYWITIRTERGIRVIATSVDTLERQLSDIQQHDKEANEYKPNIVELQGVYRQMLVAMIFENPHTKYSMKTIRIKWEQLLSSIKRLSSDISNQIFIRDSRGITEEQIKKYKTSFQYFDKDRSLKLEPLEARLWLVYLGYAVNEDDKSNDHEFNRVMALCDPRDKGYVTFQSSLDFVSRQAADTDSVEQIKTSFKVILGNKPYITADELRRDFPQDQAEYCISRMAAYTGADALPGALDYMSFSTALYGESDF